MTHRFHITSNLRIFQERTATGRDFVLGLSGVWIFVEESFDEPLGPRCVLYATLEPILSFNPFVVTFGEVIHQMPVRWSFHMPTAWTLDPLCFFQDTLFVFFLPHIGVFPEPVIVFRWLHQSGTFLKRDSGAIPQLSNHFFWHFCSTL